MKERSMMIDQAADLRKLVSIVEPATEPITDSASDSVAEIHGSPRIIQKARVLSITSGKGGVGKTNITVNLAYALKQLNKKVLILDADLGLANVDILLGISTKWNLQHVVQQEKSIFEVIATSVDGLQVLPASSGIEEMAHLSTTQKLYLKSQLNLLDQRFDFILIDTAAGISSNVVSFNQMAQEVIVVLSPDPTSLADAYAIIKILAVRYGVAEFHIIANHTHNALHGKHLFQRLEKICRRFLKIPIRHLGTLSVDSKLVQAARNQQIVVKEYPQAKISQEIHQIAESVGAIPYDPWSNKNINFLLNNVLKLGQE